MPVLIVDDSAAKRLSLKSVLSPLGYLIVEADSGTAALRSLLTRDFAVIVLDVCMPGMNGFDCAALIRQRRQSEMTPIIFITSYASDEIPRSDLYAQGAVDFIFAPVPPAELRAKVSVFANLFIRAEELAARARAVQESADQLRLLTDAAPIGIFQTDATNRYVYTNPRWSELTGIRAGDAAGKKWDSILSPEDRAGLAAEGAGAAGFRTELSRRFRIDAPDEPQRIVLVTSRSMPDSDGEGVAGWVGTLADVTAEAGAEAAMAAARDEATEASRLKSDFLANMSHEIRTPMNGIIGMVDLLIESDLDTRQRDYAQTVRSSSGALLNILNQILDFSKIEAGAVVKEEIEFRLQTTIDDVVDLLAGPAEAKGLELTAVVEGSVPAFVTGDPSRLRQVLTNLIGNAIKFTQRGIVAVRVTSTPIEGTDAIVRFEVSDTGEGIAADKLVAVFEPFVQADTSTSRKYGGTGLGLAITAQLVALMGGACGVSSTLGIGSDFWFTIRVRTGAVPTDLDGSAPGGGMSSRPPANGSIDRGRLLLAEDNVVNQKVAVAMLSGGGYIIDVVDDGAAAVEAVAARRYDAILMDCQMPVLDGYEATAAIRALEGPGRHTPIIAVTASTQRVDRDRCLAEGMDNYLAKPVSKNTLVAMLERYIEREPDGASQDARALPG